MHNGQRLTGRFDIVDAHHGTVAAGAGGAGGACFVVRLPESG